MLRANGDEGQRPAAQKLEMLAYRVPQARVVARKGWQAAKRFLRDVGTSIVAVSTALWLLLTVPMPGRQAETEIESSVAATIGHAIEPVTRPAGFDWRINVGLIGPFGAREVMVGTDRASSSASKTRATIRPRSPSACAMQAPRRRVALRHAHRPRAPRLLRSGLLVHKHGRCDSP